MLTFLCSPRHYKLDVKLPPVVWNETLYQQQEDKKLRVGFYTHDDVFKTSPACVRAVQMVCDALKKAGHRVS